MRVGTLGRSLSAPALMRTAPLAEVKPDEAADWESVAKQQAVAHRQQRLEALQTAHSLVGHALKEGGAPVSVLAEHGRIALPPPDLPQDEFEKAEHAFATRLGATLLAKTASRTAGGASAEPPRYGGDIGDLIFQSFSSSVTVPALKDFIGAVAQATRDCPLEVARERMNASLPSLLRIGTRDRGLIAHMTGTRNAHHFGERIPAEGYLHDPVSERPSWKNWASRIGRQINSHFVGGKFSRSRPRDLWPGGRSPWPDETPLDVITSRDGRTRIVLNAANSQGVYESTDGAGARYTFRMADSSIRDIACHHIPTPEHAPTETVFQNELFQLIRMDHPSPVELRDGLARLLHRMATSSLLFRGGAAFTERMLDALARHHGYQLDYPPEWTPPAGIPPDQQALCVFDTEAFVQASARHLVLTPLAPA